MNIDVDKIREGMYLAVPVYSENGTLAIPGGAMLQKRHIAFLKKMGINDVQIATTLPAVEDPIVISREEEKFQRLIREEMFILLQNSITNYSNILNKNDEGHQVIYNLYRDISHKRQYLDYILDLKSIDLFTYRHSINVMVISILIATAMGFSQEDLFVLGIGALFHDIGKVKVPREILFSNDALDPEDKLKVENHTINGYEILSRVPDFPEESALIALQHHERADGSGYPEKIKEENIHIYSQIIGIADTFEAMTSDRSYRRGYKPEEIVEYLMANAGTLFDEPVIKALLKGISIYRIGSVVQLNNNECGVVINSNPNFPTRPILRIIFDHRQLKVRKQVIVNLADLENTTLSIVRVFG